MGANHTHELAAPDEVAERSRLCRDDMLRMKIVDKQRWLLPALFGLLSVCRVQPVRRAGCGMRQRVRHTKAIPDGVVDG